MGNGNGNGNGAKDRLEILSTPHFPISRGTILPLAKTATSPEGLKPKSWIYSVNKNIENRLESTAIPAA